MIWIMVITIFYGAEVQFETLGFRSKEACDAAAREYKADVMNQFVNDWPKPNVSAVCIAATFRP